MPDYFALARDLVLADMARVQALEQAQARVKTRPSWAECPCCGTRLVMLGDGDLVTWEEAVDDDPETFKDP